MNVKSTASDVSDYSKSMNYACTALFVESVLSDNSLLDFPNKLSISRPRNKHTDMPVSHLRPSIHDLIKAHCVVPSHDKVQ